MLYGNPVLGPTGEDPMYIYIENLVELGYKNRDGSNIKDIDVRVHIRSCIFLNRSIEVILSSIADQFVTEIPRRRVLKKG